MAADDPQNPYDYSHPAEPPLWSAWIPASYVTVVEATPHPPVWQGWIYPYTVPGPYWNHPDHNRYFAYNIERIKDIPGIEPPFVQEAGTTYWLFICAGTLEGAWGWKTADVDSYPLPYTGSHFQDNAVYMDSDGIWKPLYDPRFPDPPDENAVSLDLAFVITSEEPVPTVSEWGLVVMTLLLLAGGKVYFRHRRQAVA